MAFDDELGAYLGGKIGGMYRRAARRRIDASMVDAEAQRKVGRKPVQEPTEYELRAQKAALARRTLMENVIPGGTGMLRLQDVLTPKKRKK